MNNFFDFDIPETSNQIDFEYKIDKIDDIFAMITDNASHLIVEKIVKNT